ncbi:MAG TPA: 3-phosphoshikimate 1-carboxyvinyltransferase [Acidimicrobiia bacterium]|nr:3-phosphoshikimate 1-carboxyvinyltransferase [Acidimicrobiia bacterium]
MTSSFPARLEIEPLRGALDATVRPPGSKSITNRALLVAALAAGASQLAGALRSDDTDAMRRCLQALGVEISDEEDPWRVEGVDGAMAEPAVTLDAGASGTTARFVTAAATLAAGPSTIDGTPRMRERPIGDLVTALRAMGGEIETPLNEGFPPVRVDGGGIDGGQVTIDARRSSQFASAVLMVAPYSRTGLTLGFVDDVIVSRPYVGTTLEVMTSFGAEARWAGEASVRVEPGGYRGIAYAVEADASAAAYPFAAAAVTGGVVRVDGIPSGSTQADLGLLDVLEAMGCEVSRSGDRIEVSGPGPGDLRGVDVDMTQMPDAVLALAVVAAFADRPSTIRGASTLRIKETDRLAALETELRRIGAGASAGPDMLTVVPAPLRGALVRTYDDHRMAMAFTIAGLRVPGVVIDDPGCVTKTWPGFFAEVARWTD